MPGTPTSSDFNRDFSRLLDVLACPACQGELRVQPDRVACRGCGRTYPVVDGIPVLIEEQANPA